MRTKWPGIRSLADPVALFLLAGAIPGAAPLQSKLIARPM